MIPSAEVRRSKRSGHSRVGPRPTGARRAKTGAEPETASERGAPSTPVTGQPDGTRRVQNLAKAAGELRRYSGCRDFSLPTATRLGAALGVTHGHPRPCSSAAGRASDRSLYPPRQEQVANAAPVTGRGQAGLTKLRQRWSLLFATRASPW
jgi:hypothetical protein